MSRPLARPPRAALLWLCALAPLALPGCDAKRGSAFPNYQRNVVAPATVHCERVVEFYLPVGLSLGADDYPTKYANPPVAAVQRLFDDARWVAPTGSAVESPVVRLEAASLKWRSYTGSRSYTEYTANGYRLTLSCDCALAPDAAPGDYEPAVVFPHLRTALQKQGHDCSVRVVTPHDGPFAPENTVAVSNVTAHSSPAARLYTLYGRWVLIGLGVVLIGGGLGYVGLRSRAMFLGSRQGQTVARATDSLFTFDLARVSLIAWLLLIGTGIGCAFLIRYSLRAFAADLPAAATVGLCLLAGLAAFALGRFLLKFVGFSMIRP